MKLGGGQTDSLRRRDWQDYHLHWGEIFLKPTA